MKKAYEAPGLVVQPFVLGVFGSYGDGGDDGGGGGTEIDPIIKVTERFIMRME